MRKSLLSVVGLLVVVTMLMAPLQGGVKAQTTFPPQPERQYEELPQEIIDAFEGGMTVDEFLAQNKGPIPMALWNLTDKKIAVVIEMEAPSLVSNLLATGKTIDSAPALMQRNYVAELQQAQEPLTAKISNLGGDVISQYTRVYNGVLALVPGKDIESLRSLPGVKAIHNAPLYEPTLAASVPLIQADDVWAATPGYDGTGVTVAVIDTGIDYTHAAFGGVGTAQAYADNDPDIIEAGSFPTAKVIGGYDLAGTAYNANGTTDAQLIPVPDDDPLDEGGHGTHVASTAAGMGVEGVIGKGVAPAASLYAFKVFGASGSTNLVVDALEMAMDPNGDGDLSDRVDVINMSLGSVWGVADSSDPEQVAIDLISQMGTVVVVSAGNEGNSTYVTGSPAVTDAAISVAASTTGYITLPTIKYGDPISEVPYQPANPFTTAMTANLVDVDAIDGTGSGLLCAVTDIPEGSLTGAIALIQRGTCNFENKINNAAARGAIGAIIYNAATSTNEFVSMAVGSATLPAGSTLRSYGLALKAANGTSVTVGPDSSTGTFAYGLADTVASFSSRGPRGYDSKLKPEITAPGVAIFAAAMGTGAEGVSMNGTSMAAPHVTGVAALMKQAHPDWTVEQIKAAMMSTAEDLNSADANGYQIVPRTGAGRVNAYNAVFTPTIATGDSKLVSLSWGEIEYGEQTDNYLVPTIKQVRIQNLDSVDRTYDVSVLFTDAQPVEGASLEVPPSVTVAAGSTGWIPVSLTLHPNELSFGDLEEYYGFVVFTPQDDAAAVRVPFYFVPRPYNTLTERPDSIKTMPADGSGLAQVNFDVTGSTASSLWTFTLVGTDPNELDIQDRGDLRAVGMDYGGTTSRGNILSVAFDDWGGVHTPQPYYSETDLMMDYDQDGTVDYVFFNHNYGAVTGGDDNNDWIIIQIDLATGILYLGSPYSVYADFNSGLMEWYLPDAYAGFNDATSPLDYAVYSYDGTGAEDEGPAGSFDYLRPPLASGVDQSYLLGGQTASMLAGVNDPAGYATAQPLGIMLIDYNGKPGYGQVYPVLLTTNANQSPTTVSDTYTTDEDVTLTVTAANGVLANDTDPNSDPLTAVLAVPPEHGALTFNTDGSFVYVPDADWNGTDAFVYRASDGLSVSFDQPVVITVNPVNDAPVASTIANTTWIARQSGSYTIDAFTDVDGDTLTYTVKLEDGSDLPTWLSFDATSLTFSGSPSNANVGAYVIKVSANDGNGGTADTSFTLTVAENLINIFLPLIHN